MLKLDWPVTMVRMVGEGESDKKFASSVERLPDTIAEALHKENRRKAACYSRKR